MTECALPPVWVPRSHSGCKGRYWRPSVSPAPVPMAEHGRPKTRPNLSRPPDQRLAMPPTQHGAGSGYRLYTLLATWLPTPAPVTVCTHCWLPSYLHWLQLPSARCRLLQSAARRGGRVRDNRGRSGVTQTRVSKLGRTYPKRRCIKLDNIYLKKK